MCEWTCRHCNIDMRSIVNGVTWCPSCGKITSTYAPEMMPAMAAMIFEAKRSSGKKVAESKIKVTYGAPNGKPELKIVS